MIERGLFMIKTQFQTQSSNFLESSFFQSQIKTKNVRLKLKVKGKAKSNMTESCLMMMMSYVSWSEKDIGLVVGLGLK